MLINEVCKITKLTKKAIEYYTFQGLVSPVLLNNGYRDYSKKDVQTLNKIKVLRKLDISTDDIRKILSDSSGSVLQEISVKKELKRQSDKRKSVILKNIIDGAPYEQAEKELSSLEQYENILERLSDAFPGYYGRFITLHFGRFLNEPIKTDEQKNAYYEIISFLDNLPDFDIPSDLNEYLTANTEHIGVEQISDMLDNMEKSYENPDKFLSDNKEILEQYIKLRQSKEYKNSPAYKLSELIVKFNNSTGYNDVFIPAMKQLSHSYALYYSKLEKANEKLKEHFPQINKIIEKS